ncbi:MAG: hypothetical protein R3D80_01710 [Paracoccaceae bacterium]
MAATIWAMIRARRLKIAHEFPVKPVWAEPCSTPSGAAAISASSGSSIPTTFPRPVSPACSPTAARPCRRLHHRLRRPISVLLLILIAVTMMVVAKRTRLGRYIFATGGNPEAAALAGINIRFLTVKLFMIMGALAAISAVVASSRQTFHSNDIGTLDELRVIAAAVIGGTAFAGGIGTIHGAILGGAHHAVAAIGHGDGRRRRAVPEHRRRPRAGDRGSDRHLLSQTDGRLTWPIL